ncbi:uncharacterized protein [Dermacentor albipictus]|uniref:uncharacterized protein n=1 Tax=Dermacentor albipictus TaxID=60249 RepID=UPI0038FC8936
MSGSPEVRPFSPSVPAILAGAEGPIQAVGGRQAKQRCQEDYDWLRPVSYPDTDVISRCFSIDSPDSLENNPVSGSPQVRPFSPSVPAILAGAEGPVQAVGARQAKQRCQEDYERLQPVSYPDTDVISRCFSVDSPDSLETNPESGKPDVRHFCPNVPVILAGNKTDLRNDPHTLPELAKTKRKPIAPKEGRTMEYEINAYMSLPGVLCQDQGRHARSVGDCYDGRPIEQETAQYEMHSTL